MFLSSPGHPRVFTHKEELAFATKIDKMCEYGCPPNELDLRYIVKAYLTKQGKTVKCFCNNMPGYDWMMYSLETPSAVSQVLIKH